MAFRKKLYIELSGSQFLASPSIGVRRVIAFNVTQTTNGTVASDKYGNFLPSLPPVPAAAGVGVADTSRQPADVSAGFAQRPGGATSSLCLGIQLATDFIAATGVATTLTGIDPVATRNFRVRLTAINVLTNTAAARGGVVNSRVIGRMYVQRQHSIEV